MKTRPEYTKADYKNSIQHLGKKRENTVLPCQYKLLYLKNKNRNSFIITVCQFFHSCRKSVHKSILLWFKKNSVALSNKLNYPDLRKSSTKYCT